jgi:SAM-dependent methyltransferase
VRAQLALDLRIDPTLSWSEAELPERERTKHVHRLHPYLGKFVPQLAEAFLRRYVRPGQLVWDPFVGSGTTLVEANALGARAAGCDVSAFNCLLTEVKTARYEPAALLADVLRLSAAPRSLSTSRRAGPYLRRWFAPRAIRELLAFRERLEDMWYPDLWRVVLSRSARSARLARHDDLDFPREPARDDYFCHKHRRVCHPVGEADKFLRRYVRDALQRVQEFGDLRTDAEVAVLHGDARVLDPPGPVDLVLTSPPYPGLIDYHEQHAYAFELLGLERRDDEEIGRGVKGYCEDVAAVFRRCAAALRPGGKVVVVVNDRRGLYDEILPASGLAIEERLTRHVNRRTGRRNSEFYEDVLVARRAPRSSIAPWAASSLATQKR